MKNGVVWGNYYGQWRIQDSQTGTRLNALGARIEAPKGLGRREGVLLHAGGGDWGWGNALPHKKLIWDLKMSPSTGLLGAIFAVQLSVVHAENTALGLRKLAAICTQIAKSGKTSPLETIRGTIVSFCIAYDLARHIIIITQTSGHGPLNPPLVMSHSWSKSQEISPFVEHIILCIFTMCLS